MLRNLSPLKDFKRRRKRIRGYHKRWVYSRHEGKCFLCGLFVIFTEATVDHWHPLAHGGKHSRYNFVLSCPRCNRLKDNAIPADEQAAEVAAELREIRSRFKK